ncbi:hypothetical protein [Lysobacter sp. 22409]|jgi:hypothetical protein|uniref:hypothetical protein n=1 Tax=Lysobacter sp. 22409 TaxID=3453917 RepID=UPI003F875182
MNAAALNFDLYALASPKSMQDLIALAHEALFEIKRINGYLDGMFAELDCPVDA